MNVLDFVPLLGVSIDGIGDDELETAILDLELSQRTYEPAACEVRLRDATGALAERVRLGNAVRVRFDMRDRPLFSGTLAAIEHRLGAAQERELRLLAFDALGALRSRRAVRVHVEVTFADIARELTRGLGITIECPATPVYARIVQQRRSDLDLLADVAERSGLAFRLDGTTLRAYPLAGDRGTIALEYGKTLREATVVETNVDDVSAVDVRGWDAGRIQPRRGGAVGEGSAPALPLTNLVIESDAHADALARSQLARRKAAKLQMEAVADGNPDLVPGVCVTLAGVPAAISGPHALTVATHRLSAKDGYTTTIETAPPLPHTPLDAVSGTLGVVADVRDPASLGRVKVRYPALADAESDWLQVLAAGAGGGKGLVALPSVGDNVLVIVFDGDAAHGVVLGALYGSGGMPRLHDRTFAGYAFYSPGGHVIELADGGALSLRSANGTYVELGPKTTTLHSENDLTIDAPGKVVTIRARHVDLNQA